MSKLAALCGSAAVVALISGGATAQSSFEPANNNVVDRASLGVGTSFSPLDLSTAGFLNGSVNFGNNGYQETYIGQSGNFTGQLTVEVFGNVSEIGAGLTDVLMIYTFLGAGGRVNGAEGFQFGVDTSVEIDFSTLKAATHGRIDSDTFLEPSQQNPGVTLFDNVSANDTWLFDYAATGSGPLGELGGSGQEIYSWYVQTGGDVKLNFVDVLVTDFGAVTIQSMALVNNPEQPDLGVPTPGAAALLALGVGVAGLRRRRA